MVKETNAIKDFMSWNEEMAHKYDPSAYHLHPNPLIRWIERRRVTTIIDFLIVENGDRILEVGCGGGDILERIASGHLFGIDLSKFLLGNAKKRLADHSVSLSMSDGEFLPFGANSFEKVVCSEVLEHVPDPRSFVQEMVRVTKPGGIIVISVPNEPLINQLKDIVRLLSLWRLLNSQKGYRSPERMTDEWHLHDFDLAMLKETVQGLIETTQIQGIPFRFLPLRYVISGQPETYKNDPK